MGVARAAAAQQSFDAPPKRRGLLWRQHPALASEMVAKCGQGVSTEELDKLLPHGMKIYRTTKALRRKVSRVVFSR
jgi:hypothetical protein